MKVQVHTSLEPPLESSGGSKELWAWSFIYTQSEPEVFDESRVIMTFLTILGITKILCSFYYADWF